MNPRPVWVIIALFQLGICTVSAVTVFPGWDPDFSLVDATVSGVEPIHLETVCPSSSDHKDIVWSEYNFQRQAGIAATGTGCIIISGINGSFTMKLDGIGHSDAIQRIRPGTNVAEGNRLDIIRPGYTEWYLSRNEGIEQGISITTQPEGSGNLLVSYTLGGDLHQALDRQTLIFSDRYGPVMQYGGLAARDSTGKVLPSEMKLYGNRLIWKVDDRDAVYPIIIDPYITTQTAILSASDKETSAFFGNSVSIYNDTAVIGAYGVNHYAGQAYIFKEMGGIWSQVAILNASDKATSAFFGQSVSLYKDTALVGANGANSSAGRAYVFKNTGGTWGEVAILNASDRGAYASFGTSVSLYDDTALVGASGATSGGYSTAGQAYIFKNTGGTWCEVAILNASDRSAGANFGTSVSLNQDTAVIGANGANSSAGRAYVFKNTGGTWGEVAILNASDRAASASFGTSVSLYDDLIFIGASGAKTYAGQVYVFKNTGGTWNEVAILNASDKAAYASFGQSVSLYNDTALVGASGATSEGYSTAGQTYVFKNVGGTWSQMAVLNASDKTNGAYFGSSVSQSHDIAVIGAKGVTSGVYSTAGQAYIFTLVEYPVPAVTGISPKSGPLAGGTLVTVSGTGFTGVTAVQFDSTPGIITGTPTDTSMTVIAPSGTGTVDITVITPGGTSGTGLTDRFTYASAPDVTSITPSTGINSSATTITVTGTGFETTTAPIVNLARTGYNTVSLTGVSGISTSLSGTVPEGLIAGIWNVSVTNPDGQESGNLTTFTVTAPVPAPTITAISPGSGANTGPVTVSIVGNHFNTTETGSTTVKLTRAGEANITVTGLTPESATSITAVSLPITGAAVGTWNVVIVNPDGQEGFNSSVTFTITNPFSTPSVTGITPSNGVNPGTVDIAHLTGTNFTPGALVKLNRTGASDIIGSSVTVVSPTNITCAFDLNGTTIGKYNVVVANSDGWAGMLENGFTVTGATPTPTPTTSGSIRASDDSSPGSGAAVATSPGAAAGELMTFSFNRPNDDMAPLRIVQVQVIPARPLGEMSMLVNPVTPGESNQLNSGQPVAGYREIEPIAVNPGALSSGIITFRVTSSWLALNDVAPAQVTMLRNHDGTWSELPTTYISHEGNFYYYSAMTPGFSYFAVAVRNISTLTSVESQAAVSVIISVSPVAATTNVTPGQIRIPTTDSTVTPSISETTIAPPSAPGRVSSVGISCVPVVISAVIIILGVVGIALVRRWWIRRQNPALFRKYD